jgi:hypothetical protein
MMVTSLVVTPWLLVRMPANYFQQEKPHLVTRLGRATAGKKLLILGRNLLGLVFLVCGILMLVLPGQGLLTLMISFVMMDFPGKFHLEQRLVKVPQVHKSIDWLRRKYGKPPLEL